LIISLWTFSMQLGAGTSLFCLSQCTISFYTLSAHLREPITVRSTLSGFIKPLSLFLSATWVSSPYFFFLKSLCYLIISPVPTCLVHNCKTSQRSFIFLFVITFVLWSNSLWSLSAWYHSRWPSLFLHIIHHFLLLTILQLLDHIQKTG